MANTTVPATLVKKYWAKDCWESGLHQSYFEKFTGTGSNSIIQLKEELKKEKGDTINIPLLMPLTGNGITGDSTLEGNEEAMIYRDFNVSINQLRNAVRLAGRFEEQKTQLDMRSDAKRTLAAWLAKKIDLMIFSALSTTPTSDRVLYAGTATSDNTITASDTFTAAMIGKAKRLAMANEDTMIKPITIDGADHYVMIVDQYQARDLMNDTNFRDAQKYANIRGKENPIFSGALGMYDGVVIHEHNRVVRANNSGSIPVSHALFLGQQAGVMAIGGDLRWEEEEFDYKNQVGFSIGRIFGVAKSQFKYDGTNNTDFGVINVVTASPND